MSSAVLRLASSPEPSHSAANRLESAREVVEARFLEAGDVVARAVEGLGQLIASLDRLGETINGDTVLMTTEELKSAAADLLALPRRHAGRHAAVQRLAAAGKNLESGIEDMRRNLAYLRIFAINIKITAGGIAAADGEFSDFAQEICDCIERGRAQLDLFDAELRTLHGSFETALAYEQALVDRCTALLPAAPNGLNASAAAMVAHHQRIALVADDVAALAQGVRKKIGAALAAMQIGDITRQRIEHVGETLELLRDAQGVTKDQRERMTDVVHGLVAAQLRAAAGDFHRDVDLISAAMIGIARDASEILRLRDLAFGRSEAGDEGFLSQLDNHVGKALVLVGEMDRAEEQASAMGASAVAAAAGLNARIAALQTINTDVQHMALNTALKCGRIGDCGKPLAVIAVELRVYAGHLEASAQTALSALEAVSRQADLLSGGEDGEGRTDRFAGDIGVVLANVSGTLREAGDAVETDLESLAHQGKAVVDALNRAADCLNFRRDIGVVLDEAAAAFASRAGSGTPSLDDLSEPLGDLLTTAAKSYTMAQERDVHTRFTADIRFTVAAPAVIESRMAEDCLDAVLF